MPDITMCEGGGCPMRTTCYRATATPTPRRQSYFMNPPYDAVNDVCERYVPDGRTVDNKEEG